MVIIIMVILEEQLQNLKSCNTINDNVIDNNDTNDRKSK